MRSALLVLILATPLPAQPETGLPASRLGHALVLNNVFLNGAGPFRMMIDTGNASSLIRPSVARRLGTRPAYAVDRVTAAGTHRLPVVVLDRVTTGTLSERGVEAMIGNVRLAGVDGVLGQSWLSRHDYLLDYRERRVVIGGAPPRCGTSLPLRTVEGLPSLTARVDGQSTELILDSGTSSVVLFERTAPTRNPATLMTNGDSVEAQEGEVRIALPGDRERHMRAVRVNSLQRAPGLLPASGFAAVFVSNRDGYVQLTR